MTNKELLKFLDLVDSEAEIKFLWEGEEMGMEIELKLLAVKPTYSTKGETLNLILKEE